MTTPAAGDPEAHDGFERVHIELDWWDGPRSGLADVDGAPCYFQSVDLCEPDDEFLVWPASGLALALEREQWAIFVKWNHRYETGSATVDSHPGQGESARATTSCKTCSPRTGRCHPGRGGSLPTCGS